MTCPICERKATAVIDSRADCESVMRKRECKECGFRFPTIEIDLDMFEKMTKVAVKKDDE